MATTSSTAYARILISCSGTSHKITGVGSKYQNRLTEADIICITAYISPYRARPGSCPPIRLIETFVRVPPAVCKQPGTKDRYARIA